MSQQTLKSPQTPTPYSDSFYESITEQSRRSADVIIPLVLGLLGDGKRPVGSVVDVGCGAGAWLASCIAHGIEDVRGLDGEYVEAAQLVIPQDKFVSCNLERQRADELLRRRFDLAISLEVAEHLTEPRSHELVDSLARLAPVVLFSAALPHQEGTHHINCQWQSYWAERFMDRGFVPFDVVRPKVWDDRAVEWWFAQNTILYVERTALTDYPGLGPADELEGEWKLRQLDRVHPRFLEHLDSFETTRSLREIVAALPGAVRAAVVRRVQRAKSSLRSRLLPAVNRRAHGGL
jgi:SAM-dependent methyltransferase